MKKFYLKFRNEDEDLDVELLVYSDEVFERVKEKESDVEVLDFRWVVLLKFKNKD